MTCVCGTGLLGILLRAVSPLGSSIQPMVTGKDYAKISIINEKCHLKWDKKKQVLPYYRLT
jgi:hypothetical protein